MPGGVFGFVGGGDGLVAGGVPGDGRRFGDDLAVDEEPGEVPGAEQEAGFTGWKGELGGGVEDDGILTVEDGAGWSVACG